MITQAGPLARNVDDCELMFNVLAENAQSFDTAPVSLGDPQAIDIRGLNIAAWEDDGYFPASPPVRRAVREAAQVLSEQGAVIHWLKPPRMAEMIELYYAIVGSDGGVDAGRMLRGSKVDHRVSRMLWMASLPLPVRWSIVQTLRLAGQKWQANLVSVARPRSAAEFWQLCEQLGDVVRTFHEDVFAGQGIQAILTPPHALPAPPHKAAIDLLPAASYAYHANLLGLPAGVVPWTTVRSDECLTSASARDIAERRAEETLIGAEGLPIGIQIAAPRWQEHVVLAIMRVLERLQPAK
jgi:fatty acid amide hydrolase